MERCLIYERLKSANYCNMCRPYKHFADHFRGPTGTWDFVRLCDTKQAQDHSDSQAEMGQFRRTSSFRNTNSRVTKD